MFNVNATLFEVVLQLCLFLLFNAIKICSYLIFKELFEILKHVFRTKVLVAGIFLKFL